MQITKKTIVFFFFGFLFLYSELCYGSYQVGINAFVKSPAKKPSVFLKSRSVKIVARSRQELKQALSRNQIPDNILDAIIRENDSKDLISALITLKTTKEGKINSVELLKVNEKFKYLNSKKDINFISKSNLQNLITKKEHKVFEYPLPGSKISSYFGFRLHPITKEKKLHKGVDFAGNHGKPIKASRSGRIEFIGRNGGYGKFIKIFHTKEYKTAYAHLSDFQKDLKVGSYVAKGETIGYVGSTGKSTGAHLHYEILYKNKHVDPLVVHKSLITKKTDLSEFRNAKIQIFKINDIEQSASTVF